MKYIKTTKGGDAGKGRREIMIKQIKLARAVDSLIETRGEPAFTVIFDPKKPQSCKDIKAITRKSIERQAHLIM